MREISTSITFEIADGETVPMRIGRSVKLVVQGAPVWATRSNDTEDYWLVPGGCLKLRERERLWLSTEKGRTAAGGVHVGAAAGSARDWMAGRAVSRGLPGVSGQGGRTV